MSEEQIRSEVLRELWCEPRLKGADIGASVLDATVTLTGTVASQAELLAALETARRADGVFDVVNRLRVNAGGARPADREIAGSVRRALESVAMTRGRTIQVAVSNGWVALHGKVGRPAEFEEFERIARATDGVRGVYNLIEIISHATTGARAHRATHEGLTA